ncbi:MAG: hypothetical protein Q8936_19825 [Bacillota bacterium]|nr:hypothetical protein [Bacillota bacterium]
MSNDIKIGDIKFYDNYIPGLEAGNYTITINHSIEDIGITAEEQSQLSAVQEFVVSAPQFSIDASEIHSMVPPDNSSGKFADELPHIVLNTAELPWERAMISSGTPWLALLVFSEDELMSDGTQNVDARTKAIKTSVAQYLALKSSKDIFVPNTIEKEDDIKDNQACYYIQVAADTFKKIAPYKEELPYLSHVRQVNIEDKADQGIDGNGYFGIIVANRFPSFQEGKGKKNIVHLVSLEGMEEYLTPEASFDSKSSIALISLASWSFMCQGDNSEDFYGLMSAMASQGINTPEKFLLRLAASSQGEAASDSQKEVQARVQSGYVPVQYHLRSGEDTFAWYRGPLSPVLNQSMEKANPFYTADSALIYDTKNGLFDCSLAAAWQAGRSIALADQSFGKQIISLWRKSNNLIDKIFNNVLLSGSKTPADMKKFATTNIANTMMAEVLTSNLTGAIGTKPSAKVQPDLAGNNEGVVAINKTSLMEFMENEDVNAVVADLLQQEISDIAQWAARKMLLYDVPFNYLVPDQRMLPMEAIRFFYINQQWTEAMFDGLLSLGLHSSRDSSSYTIMRGQIRDAAENAMKTMRSNITGEEEEPSADSITHMSGFIMRSAVVSGWPGMSVKAYDSDGNLLKILRLELMSSNVMMAIFWGVPARLELSEPQESFQFGSNEEGKINLRNIVSGSASNTLGDELGDHYDIKSNHLRNGNVLDLSPDKATGLVQCVEAELKSLLKLTDLNLKPSDFAMQMVKSPERIVFTTQAGK